jgi:RNA polymerase sigma-70 factor (ECF subfamily)
LSDDTGLIRRIIRRGDRDAANRLVGLYYDEIYRFAFRQIGNREAAMDAVQEIFIAALRSLGTFDARKASFRTWLYRVATNKIIDMRRRFVPDAVQIVEMESAVGVDVAARVADSELLGRIEEYVRTADAERQRIYRLHIYAGYTHLQIAEMLGMKEATVKTKYYRLMQRIREEFRDEI